MNLMYSKMINLKKKCKEKILLYLNLIDLKEM